MRASPYNILFEPVQIGPVQAPNRFYAVPHATGHGWNQPSGAIALRGMKAEGGWGTVAVQISEISADTDMANHPMERIWDDSDVSRHAKQVGAIKKHGALSAIELGHGGMRARNITTGLPPIGPTSSPILRPEVPGQARQMDKSDIKAFRQSHKAAAKRAIRAGYDIIYVYAAHDLSILSHFLSPLTNKRNDEYGGKFENRLRLLSEVLEDTLEMANGERAVALRFSVAEPKRTNGLRHEEEGRAVVEALAELPDLWDVNLSNWPTDSVSARFTEEGFQLPFTDFVKSITTKPVVGVGRFTSPDLMVSLIKNGRLDLIGAARPSIADPFLPNKIREERLEEIRECIGCNICVSMDSYGLPIRCSQNPTISEEWKNDWHPETPAVFKQDSKEQKSHLIIGSGPAGLECALTLLKAGHKVTLAEARNEVGGRITGESRLPGLSSWARIRDHRMHFLKAHAQAEIFLSSPLSAEDVKDFSADTITIATGATWRSDGVGSVCSEPILVEAQGILTPDNIMGNPKSLTCSGPVLVYDDDHYYMASVLAETLAQQGHEVTYATPLPMVATWTDHTLDQKRIIERLNELDVKMVPNHALGSNLRLEDVLNQAVYDHDFAHILFVGARLPVNALYEELKSMESLGPIYRAGDCLAPGIIQAAIYSGHKTARTILGWPFRQRREQIPL